MFGDPVTRTKEDIEWVIHNSFFSIITTYFICCFFHQFDRAVQLYLETEADNDQYYLNSLQACLVATVKSSGASQSTMKLVATSLIANGRLSGKIKGQTNDYFKCDLASLSEQDSRDRNISSEYISLVSN